jgi:hypothetical protein
MNNLFISYDLYKPDRDYADLFEAIKALGSEWAHLKLTVWFVRSSLDASGAHTRLWARMQPQRQADSDRRLTRHWYVERDSKTAE